MGEVRESLFWERGSIISLEGSQALPVRHSYKGSVKVKKLEWLETVAWDRGRGIVTFWVSAELDNLAGFTAEWFRPKNEKLI
jgi:hypothetical protein